LGNVGESLELVPASALLGGSALYLLAHVAFRWRNVHTLNRQRLACALLLFGAIPVAVELPSLVTLGALAAFLTALIAFEAIHFADARDRIRHQLVEESATDPLVGVSRK
jgi:Bacterial low temperature requirement A protein (LtrA)